MKKSKIIFLCIDNIIGIALMIIGVKVKIDYYSSFMFSMGAGLFASSIVQFLREYRDSRPENAAAVQERRRLQAIDLKDERKVHLRHRAGYLTLHITAVGCFVGAFAAALVQADVWITMLLFLLSIWQYVAATIIYRYLCRNM